MPGSAWTARALTAEAMLWLCLARGLIAAVPFRMWRTSLGRIGPESRSVPDPQHSRGARRLAAHVQRGAGRLPFGLKCLPRSMALAWMLRVRRRPYVLRVASRPEGARHGEDRLHAWLESGGEIVLGELPGPWLIAVSLAG
ncbi:MAG: lasso peptide biosynthesis B2 protein [Croceibacterium sp.]